MIDDHLRGSLCSGVVFAFISSVQAIFVHSDRFTTLNDFLASRSCSANDGCKLIHSIMTAYYRICFLVAGHLRRTCGWERTPIKCQLDTDESAFFVNSCCLAKRGFTASLS